MKNIFSILALIATGAAVFTGWQVKDKTVAQIEARDILNKDNKTISRNINKKTDERSEKTEAKDASLKSKDLVVAELDTAKSNFLGFERTLDQEEVRLAEQNARVAEVDAAVAQVIEQLDDPNLTIDDVPGKYEELKEKRKQLDLQLSELESIRGGLEKDVKNATEEIARIEKKISESKARIRGNNFAATVSAVNNDWGFLVINAGEESGLEGDSELLLTRDGLMLGKVLVSSLEANQSVAEIVPGSLAAGVIVQEGDGVILADTAAN